MRVGPLASLGVKPSPSEAAAAEVLNVVNRDCRCGTVVLAACVSYFSACLFLCGLLKIHVSSRRSSVGVLQQMLHVTLNNAAVGVAARLEPEKLPNWFLKRINTPDEVGNPRKQFLQPIWRCYIENNQIETEILLLLLFSLRVFRDFLMRKNL